MIHIRQDARHVGAPEVFNADTPRIQVWREPIHRTKTGAAVDAAATV
jgi:hypothetical protein